MTREAAARALEAYCGVYVYGDRRGLCAREGAGFTGAELAAVVVEALGFDELEEERDRYRRALEALLVMAQDESVHPCHVCERTARAALGLSEASA